MIPDLTHIFSSYETLRAEADAIFGHIANKYPACVTCHAGCSDCCNALFDLSLVEAMYINRVFKKTFEHGMKRSSILEKASEIDRALTRVKREMYQAEKNGEDASEIMTRAAVARMPCPLLDEEQRCALYGDRPITCRLYGVPLSIGGKAHVCGYGAFDKGQTYPTVQLGKIQERLEALSREIQDTVKSRFELTDVYVPLSMALLTDYNEAYLGIGNAGIER